jgi:hypothetical protein
VCRKTLPVIGRKSSGGGLQDGATPATFELTSVASAVVEEKGILPSKAKLKKRPKYASNIMLPQIKWQLTGTGRGETASSSIEARPRVLSSDAQSSIFGLLIRATAVSPNFTGDTNYASMAGFKGLYALIQYMSFLLLELAIHTAAFVHVLVLLAAGFALCYGESINLT